MTEDVGQAAVIPYDRLEELEARGWQSSRMESTVSTEVG